MTTSTPITTVTDLDGGTLNVFTTAEIPAGSDTDSLLYTLVQQQAEILQQLSNMETRIQSIESDVEEIRSNVALITPDVEQIRQDTAQIRTDTTVIRDETENTISPNTTTIANELSNITISDTNASAEDICIDPIDSRNPQTLKDYLVLVKQEVRHMDDCERDCPDDSWAVEMALELSTNQDVDQNEKIFGLAGNGAGFIFNEDFNKYPEILQNALTQEVYDAWDGTKLTFNEYETSLTDANSCSIHKFTRWRTTTGY